MKISIAGTGKIVGEVMRMLHEDFAGKIEVTGIYAREKSVEHAIDLCIDGEIVNGSRFRVELLPRAVRFITPRD